ncbi:rhamnose isomerase, partial [Cryobacterium sp. TMT2-4]
MTILSAETLRLLESQAIELPSWAFGNSGTRFKVFSTPGTPRTPREK